MVKNYKLKRKLSEKQGAKLKAKYLDDTHYDLLIDHDADGYDLATGELLFRFRKNAIPFNLLKTGYESFKDSIQVTESRGAASGSIHKRIRKDGSVSNITVGNKVTSESIQAGAIFKRAKLICGVLKKVKLYVSLPVQAPSLFVTINL